MIRTYSELTNNEKALYKAWCKCVQMKENENALFKFFPEYPDALYTSLTGKAWTLVKL